MVQLVFIVFIAFVMILGWKGYQKAHSAEDLIVAGWDLPLGMCTWSLIAALTAAPFFFAAVGSGYTTGGWEAFATMGGLGTCMILGAFIWVKPIRRLRGWTIGDYYGLRFADKKLGAYAGGLMIIAFGMMNAGALSVGGAYIVQTIFDIPFWAALAVFVIITAVYSLMGGLWSLAYADILNGIISVAGIAAVTVIIFLTQGDYIFHPDWWDISRLFTVAGVDFWVLYLVLAIGDIPAADLGQRACGARNPRIGQLSMIIAGLVVLGIAWTPGILGEAFKVIFPGVDNPEPLPLTFASMYFHPVFAGFFLTAWAGMAMSTLAACIVSSAGISTKNLYLDFAKIKPAVGKLLAFTRWNIVLFAVIAIVFALAFQRVLELAYMAWDVIFVTIPWPLVIPPFWKRVSAKACWISITVGLAIYILTSIFGVPGPDEGSLIWMIFQVPAFFGALISLITLIVGSLIFPPTEEALRAHEIEIDSSRDHLSGNEAS